MRPDNPILAAGLLFFMMALVLVGGGCWQYQVRVEAYLKAAHESWGFDGAVLISKRGRVLFSQGYGLANKLLGEPNAPQTRFFIGSITKQFTAAAILILYQEHRLNLDDPITKYLADYPHNPGDQITIRQLLTHSSGIPNYTDDPEIILRRTQSLLPGEIIDRIKNRSLEFEPGTAFKYGNSGYVLLGRIIEIVSGQSYEAFLHHRIFNPIGMKDTGYGRRESAVPERADGYTIDRAGDKIAAVPVDYSILYSAGALYSTVEDMSKWSLALNKGKIIDNSLIEDMFSPHMDNYGYGWFLENKYGRRHAYHGGFLDGFNTLIDRWLDDSLCIIVFSNDDESPVARITRGLAAIAFDEPYTLPVKKRPARIESLRFDDYVGIYMINKGACQYITGEQDALYTHIQGMPWQALLPQAIDTFFFSTDNSRLMIFIRNKDGLIGGFRIFDDEGGYAARRLTGPDSAALAINRHVLPIDSDLLQQYSGTYEVGRDSINTGSGFVLNILAGADHLEASVVKEEAITLFPNSKTTFFQKESDFQIIFTFGDNGRPNGCIVQMGGLKFMARKIN